jgi:hypothetical protein
VQVESVSVNTARSRHELHWEHAAETGKALENLDFSQAPKVCSRRHGCNRMCPGLPAREPHLGSINEEPVAEATFIASLHSGA